MMEDLGYWWRRRVNLRLGSWSRLFAPHFGRCKRCDTPWRFVRSHVTYYEPGRGVFALCEKCWAGLDDGGQRLPYYRLLAGEYEEWPEIQRAVMAEGAPGWLQPENPWPRPSKEGTGSVSGAAAVDEVLRHLGALELREGDLLVLQLQGHASQDEIKRASDLLGRVVDRCGIPRTQAIVLDRGATLGVVRKAANA